MVEILTISLIAWWFSVGLGFVQWLKWRVNKYYYTRRLKPFDCPKCMAWWIALVYFFSTGHPTQYVLIYAIISSTFAIIIEKGIARL